MRPVIWLLIALLLVLQYRLWFGQGSYTKAWVLRQQVEQETTKNTELEERNAILEAEVDDLKEGHQAIEERARNDLGMVKNNETFYQTVHPTNQSTGSSNADSK